MLENGAWALVRASSNTPNLVVVCESPDSEAELRAIFATSIAIIRTEPRWAPTTRTFDLVANAPGPTNRALSLWGVAKR